MTISKELRDFLQSWLDWVEVGAPDKQPYHRKFGLCSNVEEMPELSYEAAMSVRDELYDTFGGLAYPFGSSNYSIQLCNQTQHLDPVRIAWVKEQLK